MSIDSITPRPRKRLKSPAAAETPGKLIGDLMAKRKRDLRAIRPALPLLAIGLLAFALRLIVAHQIGRMPITSTPNLDEFEYVSRARQIAKGNFAWPVAPAHAPLYPLALGLMLFATGGSLMAVRMIQAFIGALTCMITALTGKRFFGWRAGGGAGLMLALYAPLIWIDVSLVAEGLLLFLLATMLWCIASKKHAAIIGMLLGLAALTRPTALIFLPLAFVAAARGWRARGALVLATVAVIAPVTIINWRTSHAFIPIQAFGGLNFYLGNSPTRDGMPSARLGGDWEKIEPEAVRHGIFTALGEDHYFLQKTEREIAAHPIAYARLLLRKMVWTFQNEEIRDTFSFYFFRRFSPLLRWLPAFWLLFGLTAAGMVLADWHGNPPWIVAAYVGLAAITCIILVVGVRYRLPMVIGCALFAGLVFQASQKRRVIPAIFAGLFATACTLAWHYAPSHDFAEEWAFTARSLGADHKIAEGERAARRAVAADPNNAFAWDELGRSLATKGETIAAANAFQRAMSITPDFTDAHIDAGMLAEQRSDPTTAVAQYEKATRLDPRSPVAWGRLAELQARLRNPSAAASAYEHLLALQPDDVNDLFALARIDAALGKPAKALSLIERAETLREPNGEEWFLTALLALQAGRYDMCEEALGHAAQLRPDDPRIPFTKALLRFHQGQLSDADSILTGVLQRYPNFRPAALLRQRIEGVSH